MRKASLGRRLAAFVALAAAIGGCATDPLDGSRPGRHAPTGAPVATSVPAAPAGLPPGLDATVVSVTDGDTIVVRIAAGTTERVRLIGIDTPEIRDPRRPVECFGREASTRTAALVPPGTAVRLELDVEKRDRYERLLAYVWTTDATLVNATLVDGGWAVPYRFPPNVRYADLFSRLGAEARAADRGLWSACGGADTPAAPG